MQSFLHLQAALADGSVTPSAALSTCFDAIGSRDGAIGTFACLADPAALAAHPAPQGPLTGIAVGIKDIFDTHDLVTTYGSPIFAEYRPRMDAAIVAMLRAGGATIIGKTVTTEYAFLEPAATRNPVNPAHTPGGSSSGSAAAVAAGMIPVAIGTQTGGSVIRPASYCGIAGYKPSFRLVPTVGMKTFSWSLDTVGFFAAGVADVAAFAGAATGRPLWQASALPRPRIGLYRCRQWDGASADMRDAVETAANALAAEGCSVVEINEPDALAAARDSHMTIQNFEAGLALADDVLRFGDQMSPRLRETLQQGRAISPETYDAARSIARRARGAAHALFGDCDVLLTPAAPGAAPLGLGSTGDPRFNKLWTLLGLPCVAVPGLADAAGLPLGVQVVAPFGRDAAALSAGALLENLLRRL